MDKKQNNKEKRNIGSINQPTFALIIVLLIALIAIFSAILSGVINDDSQNDNNADVHPEAHAEVHASDTVASHSDIFTDGSDILDISDTISTIATAITTQTSTETETTSVTTVTEAPRTAAITTVRKTSPPPRTTTPPPETTKKQVTTTAKAAEYSQYATDVLAYLNAERKKAGLSSLALDKTVNKAAQTRASEITSVFSHDRPDGRSCFTALEELNFRYKGCAENIAAGQQNAQSVVSSWMGSDGHRKNILNANYTHVGVGLVKTNSGYKYYWALMLVKK